MIPILFTILFGFVVTPLVVMLMVFHGEPVWWAVVPVVVGMILDATVTRKYG